MTRRESYKAQRVISLLGLEDSQWASLIEARREEAAQCVGRLKKKDKIRKITLKNKSVRVRVGYGLRLQPRLSCIPRAQAVI
jgi:hypothetical protein